MSRCTRACVYACVRECAHACVLHVQCVADCTAALRHSHRPITTAAHACARPHYRCGHMRRTARAAQPAGHALHAPVLRDCRVVRPCCACQPARVVHQRPDHLLHAGRVPRLYGGHGSKWRDESMVCGRAGSGWWPGRPPPPRALWLCHIGEGLLLRSPPDPYPLSICLALSSNTHAALATVHPPLPFRPPACTDRHITRTRTQHSVMNTHLLLAQHLHLFLQWQWRRWVR